MEAEITIKVKSTSPFRHADKVKMFEKIASLDAEDQDRIYECASNSKALAALKKHWKTLQMFK